MTWLVNLSSFIILRAMVSPVAKKITLWTVLNPPSPIYSITSYNSLSASNLYFSSISASKLYNIPSNTFDSLNFNDEYLASYPGLNF